MLHPGHLLTFVLPLRGRHECPQCSQLARSRRASVSSYRRTISTSVAILGSSRPVLCAHTYTHRHFLGSPPEEAPCPAAAYCRRWLSQIVLSASAKARAKQGGQYQPRRTTTAKK